jgi:formylglycine-generating enzyme required for sulfatase activity
MIVRNQAPVSARKSRKARSMKILKYSWETAGSIYELNLVHVEGTNGQPCSFGDDSDRARMELKSFFIGTVPVTQALWMHVMGSETNPALHRGELLPVENISWNQLTEPGGFLDRINHRAIRTETLAQIPAGQGAFRLPTEAEWEYAARGGPNWRDDFRFSGSNDIESVAWYDRKHGDHTQPVAQKAPNQLGIYDMSGNIWEWCQDVFTRDVSKIPRDGTPYMGPGEERILRGGCFHNWAIHCTVSKRYEIGRECHDGCIGLRIVLSLGDPSHDGES